MTDQPTRPGQDQPDGTDLPDTEPMQQDDTDLTATDTDASAEHDDGDPREVTPQ